MLIVITRNDYLTTFYSHPHNAEKPIAYVIEKKAYISKLGHLLDALSQHRLHVGGEEGHVARPVCMSSLTQPVGSGGQVWKGWGLGGVHGSSMHPCDMFDVT